MSDLTEIENLLNHVRSRVDAHKEFKSEYDKQLAFDFDLFSFFSVGENKVSQILAYFLDPKQSHGQRDLFLNDFIKAFHHEEIQSDKSSTTCEKGISNGRRIDVYIQVGDTVIAIENKIWAGDQYNQLKDYANYLEGTTKGKYLLLYLTPYGAQPSDTSISPDLKDTLVEEKKFKVISYKNDIHDLLNRWIGICGADNVSFFLKEFKKFIEIKFLGKNTLNMSKDLRAIIYSNEEQVELLANEYRNIENEVLTKVNELGKALEKVTLDPMPTIEISKRGLFNWNDSRVYKWSLSIDQNKIWVQFYKKKISLYSNYYLEDGADPKFIQIVDTLGLNQNKKIDHKLSVSRLAEVFTNQVNEALKSFELYKEHANGVESIDRNSM